MRGLALFTLVVLAACDPPSPGLRLELSEGPAQACPSTNCLEVPMTCTSWISIRIIDPSDPDSPFLSQCQQIPEIDRKNLCAVARVELDVKTLPLRDLEVQVAIYPETEIRIDPETGEPLCPSNIQYDAIDGFPVAGEITPALGGRSYYRPGDSEFAVTLGCSNLDAVNDLSCGGGADLTVLASVNDFDLPGFPITTAEAQRVSVDIGEPRPNVDQYVLNPGDLTPLQRTTGTPPSWTAEVLSSAFMTTACLAVLDDTPQSTTTLTCRRPVILDNRLEFTGEDTGVRLRKSSLDQILTTLGLTQFPARGVTIGMVLDDRGNPLANRVVAAPGATVQYLSADRTMVVGSATSAGGVFVSTDAPFGTTFSTSSGPIATASALGGMVEGKVTIALVQFTEPVVE